MLILSFLICGIALAYWAALEWLGMQWREIPWRALPWRAIPKADSLSTYTFNNSVANRSKALSGPEDNTSAAVIAALEGSCKISVIVVMRNEARNLPHLFKALAEQTLSHDHFELHLVDDASTDGSMEIAQGLAAAVPFRANIHQLQATTRGGSPKKAAIKQVLPYTSGAVIAVTDADCQPACGWLAGILALWEAHAPVFVSGPVRYMAEETLFEQIQTVEFATLIGVGAAMIQAGKPGMCNAANMAFSKQAFLEVDGYAGNDHVPSGDDEFLLQKLAACYPEKIRFLKNDQALVSTRACGSWQQFLHQRKRWAGKWRLHKGIGNKIMAVGLFLFYLLILLCCVLPFFYPVLAPYVVLALVIKSIADYRFVAPVLYFLKKGLSLKVFLLLELIYPFYVLFFAVAANVGGFTWKERAYRYSTSPP